jgi:hypothetical protein
MRRQSAKSCFAFAIPFCSLSDKAVLMAFGASLPSNIINVPWELKQQILGLRGAEWAPIVLKWGVENWGVQSPPSPYVSFVFLWFSHQSIVADRIFRVFKTIIVGNYGKTGRTV